MPSTLNAESVIQLPRLDAASALSLGRELLTVAEHVKKLPGPIKQAHTRVDSEYKTLQLALQERLGRDNDYDPKLSRQADQAEDQAFAALYDFLSAFARLPESHSESHDAQHVRSVLFADGLKFLTFAYRVEWAEAEARLKRMREDKLDQVIQKLGGEIFLKNLYAAHKAYGETLGITKLNTDGASKNKMNVSVREALQNFSSALRMYILRIVAHQDESDASSIEQSETLLQPLVDYTMRAARAAARTVRTSDPAQPGEPDEPS